MVTSSEVRFSHSDRLTIILFGLISKSFFNFAFIWHSVLNQNHIVNESETITLPGLIILMLMMSVTFPFWTSDSRSCFYDTIGRAVKGHGNLLLFMWNIGGISDAIVFAFAAQVTICARWHDVYLRLMPLLVS